MRLIFAPRYRLVGILLPLCILQEEAATIAVPANGDPPLFAFDHLAVVDTVHASPTVAVTLGAFLLAKPVRAEFMSSFAIGHSILIVGCRILVY